MKELLGVPDADAEVQNALVSLAEEERILREELEEVLDRRKLLNDLLRRRLKKGTVTPWPPPPPPPAEEYVVVSYPPASSRVAPADAPPMEENVARRSSATPRVAPADAPPMEEIVAQRSSATPRVTPVDAPPIEPFVARRSAAAVEEETASPLVDYDDDPSDDGGPADVDALLPRSSATTKGRALGRAESCALCLDVFLRSCRVAVDVVTVWNWWHAGGRALSATAATVCMFGSWVLEVGIADERGASVGAIAAAAAGCGLALHARRSCAGGRRTESYATLRMATTAVVAMPMVLLRAYDAALGNRVSASLGVGLALGVADAATAAAAATMGAPLMWRGLRAGARGACVALLWCAYAADLALRASAWSALAAVNWHGDGSFPEEGPLVRRAVPGLALLANFLLVLAVSGRCARHDRRGRGTRGRAAVRALLWMALDLPLDYDRHVRLGWAHRLVVAFHTSLHVALVLRYPAQTPLRHFAPEPLRASVAALAAAKVATFLGFWCAHFATAAPEQGRDHIAVQPAPARELQAAVSCGRRRAGLA